MHDIPELDVKGLRQFGLMLAGFVSGIFGLLLPWIWGFALPLWPWVFGVVCLVWAMAAPASIRPLYMGWMRVAMLIGEVINRLLLGVVFYLVIFPMGFIMRLMGKDPMARKLDKSIKSYRVRSKTPPKEHMEKPF
ncbi:MAG: SxtJ family membrane protein [Mariprofundaceae bacterium]